MNKQEEKNLSPRDLCINCGHYHSVDKTTKKFNCTLWSEEWDCKCREQDFVARRFKGSFG